MVCDVLRFDRPERTQAHMEGHVAEVYPHGLDLLKSASVKCSPAVGAAAEPTSLE